MKNQTVLSGVVLVFALFANMARGSDVFETSCNEGDCFKAGWITTSSSNNYSLQTSCKGGDCTRYGWSSQANDGSSYDVSCLPGGCFIQGWESIQTINGMKLIDDVTCKASSCLTAGWTVTNGYDLFGGDVTCNSSDCSRFGGRSFWRGRPSHTQCYNEDCYRQGWTLFVD